MSRKVAVLGWYGHDNIGDKLILNGLCNLFVDWQITPMSTVNTKEINKHDLLVLGGGELLPEWLYIRPLPRLLRGLANRTLPKKSWVSKVKVPKIVLGCGVDAETITEKTVLELEHFSYIGLRDKASVEILKEHNQLKDRVHLFYDCAFSANIRPKPVKVNKNLAVVVPTERQHNSLNLSWFKQKLQPYSKAAFLAFGKEDNNDLQTCKKLADYVVQSETIPYEKLTNNTIVKWMSYADKIFSCRLHGMLLAFMLKKPYEFFPYHHKLTRNSQTIEAVSPEQLIERQKQEFKQLITVT